MNIYTRTSTQKFFFGENTMSFNELQFFFKSICVVVTVGFFVHWIVVFLRNEDVSKIEIRYVEKQDEKEDDGITLPEFSMCFYHPFLDNRIKEINSSLSGAGYQSYLKGEISDDGFYNRLNYDNVTINLFEAISYIGFEFRGDYIQNNEIITNDTCDNAHECKYMTLKNNMNGFWGDLIKCYGFQLNKKYSKLIRFFYLRIHPSFASTLSNTQSFVNFNLPNQLLLMDSGEAIWDNDKCPWVKLKIVEIIQRRNKREDGCLAKEKHFDEFVLEEHIEEVGCRAPYQNLMLNVSLCKTKEKMKESKFDIVQSRKKHHLPCQSITGLSFQTDRSDSLKYLLENNTIKLQVEYPVNIKIITQCQAVDFQALVGYIGGYIGLFLGNIDMMVL